MADTAFALAFLLVAALLPSSANKQATGGSSKVFPSSAWYDAWPSSILRTRLFSAFLVIPIRAIQPALPEGIQEKWRC